MAAQERITVDQLKKGDVVTFYYTSGNDPRPVILFLNTFNGLIHGINLNYLSQSQIEYLKTILSRKANTSFDIEDPKLFYEQVIKGTPVKLAYRHYIPSKMIQIFRLGYKTETLEKDAGLKPKSDNPSHEQSESLITPVTKDGGITKTDIQSPLPGQIFGVDPGINSKG